MKRIFFNCLLVSVIIIAGIAEANANNDVQVSAKVKVVNDLDYKVWVNYEYLGKLKAILINPGGDMLITVDLDTELNYYEEAEDARRLEFEIGWTDIPDEASDVPRAVLISEELD